MAEGGDDEQSPRKTTTYQRFEGMNSQKSRYGVPDNEMFWLENIMRVAPKKLHSVPGPTGNLATFPIITPGCPASTVPTGTQSLSVVHCYDYNVGNNASQLNFVGGNPVTTGEQFVVSLSTQSGFSVPYITPGNPDVIKFVGEDTGTFQTVIPVPSTPAARFFGQSAQAGSSGHSDELSILFHMTGINLGAGNFDAKVYFNYETNAVTYLLYEFGTPTAAWAKRGTRFWDLTNPSSGQNIERYDITTGGLPVAVANYGFTDSDFVKSLSATDNFLYMLYNPAGTTATIYRLNLDTMAEVTHWDITGTFGKSFQMFAQSDDLIYLVAGDSFGFDPNWNFGYFQPSTNTATQVGTTVTRSCVNTGVISGQTSFHYNKGYFYIGYGGFATGFTDVAKIGPLVCPGTNIPIGT